MSYQPTEEGPPRVPGRAAGRPAASSSRAADAPAPPPRSADMGAVGGCFAVQGIQIPHRISGQLGRQVCGIGVPAAGRHDRVNLDQLAAPVELHRGRVDPGVQPLPDQIAGNAVARLGDLHVPVRGDLGVDSGRDVEHGAGHRFQLGVLLGGEHLGRAESGGAMHPRPRDLPTPPRRPFAALIEVPELFSSKEIRPRVRNTALDPGLVLRAADLGRIHHEPARGGILAERVVQPRIGRTRDLDPSGPAPRPGSSSSVCPAPSA